ncbi:uncharacterized protein LOC129892342 [Solanum dulcamara]|uniref:uncharacterized protein LOC129892342 n=1 Tax=Solanum dulcamara TaxID=45834 RepID=UPI0024850359|nr:uncharacterized protein LOC129892342 [Solanum dulcamara]
MVDIKTMYGGKINIIILDDIDRAVGSGARDIVNYCGLIMRSSISFRDGNWQKIVLKHGEAMWYKVKDKFEFCGGLREHKLQGFVISTMQRLFRAWKARLHNSYSAYDTDEERLSHRPEDVELEDWKYLVKYFGSEKFKRNPESGEKDTPDKVWEIQHIRKKDNGERVWLDPQSQQIHVLKVKMRMTIVRCCRLLDAKGSKYGCIVDVYMGSLLLGIHVCIGRSPKAGPKKVQSYFQYVRYVLVK